MGVASRIFNNIKNFISSKKDKIESQNDYYVKINCFSEEKRLRLIDRELRFCLRFDLDFIQEKDIKDKLDDLIFNICCSYMRITNRIRAFSSDKSSRFWNFTSEYYPDKILNSNFQFVENFVPRVSLALKTFFSVYSRKNSGVSVSDIRLNTPIEAIERISKLFKDMEENEIHFKMDEYDHSEEVIIINEILKSRGY